ncbi:MAG: rod shape-determining protein MreD [Prevotellaceae bacterium]|nr:rod shape-determining protein MreD [Prevotellaceae bacterium]
MSLYIYILRFAFLVLLQGILLNNIQLFGYVNPYLYIIFLITLPCRMRREWVLVVGFLLGLSIDVFGNTFGIHAFATTFAAFARYYLLRIFEPRNDYEELVPSITTFGLGAFFRYSLLMVLIHHSLLFFIDYFSFASIGIISLRILLSSAFTLAMFMGIEKFKTK